MLRVSLLVPVCFAAGCNLFAPVQEVENGQDAGPPDGAANDASGDARPAADSAATDVLVDGSSPDQAADAPPLPGAVDLAAELRPAMVLDVTTRGGGGGTELSSDGLLFSLDGTQWSSSVMVSGRTDLFAAVPLSTPPGTVVTVHYATDPPNDFERTIGDPVYVPTTFDGTDVTVMDTLELTDVLDVASSISDTALSNVSSLAYVDTARGFPTGLYLGVSFQALQPRIYHWTEGGALAVFAGENGTAPDENATRLRFSDPASSLGDVLLVASGSVGGGDGLFVITPTGQWGRRIDTNNTSDVFVDRAKFLEDVGYDDPMYVTLNGARFARIEPDDVIAADVVALKSGLGSEGSGYLSMAHSSEGAFAGPLWLIQRGEGANGYVASLDSTTSELDFLASGLAYPGHSLIQATGPLGDALWVPLGGPGQLAAFRRDGTSVGVVEGAVPRTLAAGDGALWLLSPDRLSVARLAPRTP